MDDYKKIPFDDPDLCVPDLDDFDQMKEFFLDCAAEYFRYLSSDDMEKMLAALGKRVDVLATPTDDVFISVSPDAVLRQYPRSTKLSRSAITHVKTSGSPVDSPISMKSSGTKSVRNIKVSSPIPTVDFPM